MRSRRLLAFAFLAAVVLSFGTRVKVAGEVIGIIGAFALTRLISSFLFGVTQWDPLSFAGAAVLLGLAALTASVLVARRALQIDPVAALRLE